MATTAINAETEHHRRFIDEYQHLSRPFGSGSFGAKAEAFARFFGTPTFLIGQTLIVGTWIVLNAAKIVHFDLYPFILLNLVLSTVAAIQAPIIMMSQNRQASKDKLLAEQDYQVNLKAEMEIEALLRGQAELLARVSYVERMVVRRNGGDSGSGQHHHPLITSDPQETA